MGVLYLKKKIDPLVELDVAVKVLLGDQGNVLDLLCTECLHLGHHCVQNSVAPQYDFLDTVKCDTHIIR